jgi:hypothetical protein
MSEPRLDIIDVPDVPAPTAVLCWKQSRLMVRCDRAASHFGRHSWDHGGAEPRVPSLADTQIDARIEQILQKFLHAEALTVGDTVFLFDLVRTLRRAAALAPPRELTAEMREYIVSFLLLHPFGSATHEDIFTMVTKILNWAAATRADTRPEPPAPAPQLADALDMIAAFRDYARHNAVLPSDYVGEGKVYPLSRILNWCQMTLDACASNPEPQQKGTKDTAL